MWRPAEGRRHDCYMSEESKLRKRLQRLNRNRDRALCLFGDKGYSISPEIQTPFKGFHLNEEEEASNKAMTNCRIVVEYGFTKIAQQFGFSNHKQNQKLYRQQNASLFSECFFVKCHTCMYGFALAKKILRLDPPTLETYLRSYEYV